MTPGSSHQLLAKAEGEWTGEMTMWMAPDAPPMKSTVTNTNKMIMGGRYQVSTHKGDFMGQPFEGISTTGYDNAKKVFISNWVDNMGTGMMNMEGTWDEATKTMSMKGKISAPYLSSYTGTKYAVEGISHCLRKELLPFGIDVVIIRPGQVQTPIWDKSSLDEFKDTRYISSMMKFFTYLVAKGKKGMLLDECSRRIANIFETEKPKTGYSIVQNKFQDWILLQLMPDRILDHLYLKKLM